MEKIKKLPFFVKGIIIVVMVSVVVIGAALGLRIMEEKQQKPRVLKAIADLAVDAADEQYQLDALLALLESGKMTYSGDVKITDMDENLLGEQYAFAAPYIKQTTFDFFMKKDEAMRKAELQMDVALYGIKAISVEGYLDDEQCIVRVPQLHESYLTFSPDNLKQQYEDSLLYTILGDSISLPQNKLTDYVFVGVEQAVSAECEALQMNFADSLEYAKQLYDEIAVTKTDKKEEILWNGKYESCTGYEMVLPTEIINKFLKDTVWEKSGHTLQLEEKELVLDIYLNNDKRLLKLAVASNMVFDGKNVPLSLNFLPKGVENAWDSVLLELEITWDDVIYGISLVCRNDFTESQRVLHTSLSLTQPYVTELFDMDTTYELETGEISFDFVCKTPMISVDGICELSAMKEAPSKPAEEPVPIFELELFDMLKFTNGLNWNFFKNQE